jgi:DNA polymerase-3 subunit alpha
MKEADVKALFAFVANTIDVEKIPLDDQKTYHLLATADTDGVYMLESDWDKYDLLQIQPKDFNELTACLALSHNPTMNPFIYTYLKIQKVQPFTFPRYSEIDAVKKILKDSHGMLLYKEQAEDISYHIASMSEEDKKEHAMAIKILIREIEKRKGTLSERTFFRARALFCYRNAFIKANHPVLFNAFIASHVLDS